MSGVAWRLEVASAFVGIGIESRGGSTLTVNGLGHHSTGEMKVSYHADEGIQTLEGLAVGLQYLTLGKGQLTLNNVQLGPIAWQI